MKKLVVACAFFSLAPALWAQVDLNRIKDLRYRCIGPDRGGRSVTVAGVPSEPNVYYFGGTGGGVWKTADGGKSWAPISDRQIKTGSVGSIAVSPSDPNIIYVSMGESDIRQNISYGDGMYKSTDAGKTWKHIGLGNAGQISVVRIDPRNPAIVYVAVLGHVYGPSAERGIYRTTDDGKTWNQVFTRGPNAGAIDLILDPNNSNVLYAAFWDAHRTPWSMVSGGPGSGLFKSTDGGNTWRDLSHNPGMPDGILGRIGVTVSPVDSGRVWAMVETADGGLFRSDNGGKTWVKVNDDRMIHLRPWYFSAIFADPFRLDTVYVLDIRMYRSEDGGVTFNVVPAPHGDNHFLWIAPNDSNRMIVANDGGATVSTDGGKTWTTLYNQPTGQFYRVSLDNDFPFHIYGAQQDNTTIRIANRSTDEGGITESDWYSVGGGESGTVVPDPQDSQIVYAGGPLNLLTRYDHRTDQLRDITIWPDNPFGAGARRQKYRFNYNFPLFISPHDPHTLYAGADVLFQSTNSGQSWETISGDLTRNDKSKQGPSGGPITRDNTTEEYYDTVFTIAESPLAKGLIWAGTDDGLVWLTRDGGKHWENVTPKGMPEWIQVNSIEASPFDPATAYFAATMYKWDDPRPYLYKTTDSGKTWERIDNGIPTGALTRVIREDPNHRGLLVAGTETGMYISFDDGATWQSFQLNLPAVPITDLAFQKREKDLVVATQGRAFWVFDDLPLLYQVRATTLDEAMHLFQPKHAYRISRSPSLASSLRGGPRGENPPDGAVVYYWFKNKPAGEVALEFLDASGKLIRKFSTQGGEKCEGRIAARPGEPCVTAEKGMNRFVWDLRYPDATRIPGGPAMWDATLQGPLLAPGTYRVRLTADGKTQTQSFEMLKDPRVLTTREEYAREFQLAMEIHNTLNANNRAVNQIRAICKQLEGYAGRVKDRKVAEAAKTLAGKFAMVEDKLHQNRHAYPLQLDNKLAYLQHVVESSDNAPTEQDSDLYQDLAGQVDAQLRMLKKLETTDLPAFNRLVREENVPAVSF